ncbi:MAG TPA: hypothetical protein PKL13_01290 [bacterium]|nr:hypothetical protein [bacterium]
MMQYLVFVGAFVGLIFTIPYIKETIKGNTKPNRVSWLLWSIAPTIGTVASISNGVGWSALPVFMSGFIPFLVFIVSFINKNSYWKLEKFDYLCGLFSVLALIFWAITKQPIIAIVFAILSDFSAAIPTLKKSWKYPETETVSAYVGGLFSAFTGFTAVKFWNFLEIAFLIYLVIMNIALIFAILRKKIIK